MEHRALRELLVAKVLQVLKASLVKTVTLVEQRLITHLAQQLLQQTLVQEKFNLTMQL